MKTSLMVSTSVAACVAVIGMVGVQAGLKAHAAPAPVMAAHHVDDFQLTDNNLMAQQLYYYKYAPAIVIMSQSDGTKTSQENAAQFDKIAASYKDKGVIFFMLNSNLTDNRDAIQAEAKKQGFQTPVLIDEQQLVGESLGVKKEGEVFVIDTKGWNVAYHGPVGDLTGKALDSVLASQPVQTAMADVKGKAIAFPDRDKSADFTKISYTNEVAPILQDKCVSCHLKGGIGPFSMDSYDVVKGFAPMIRETIRTSRMPPYFADPHIGQFQHDQGLTSDQKKTLVHWIEAGAPRGTGADPLLANKDKVAPEWPVSLGKPDVIIDLPAFSVPANGVIEYQNQRVKNPFSQDTWLRAISIKPGDRGVVHHVVSNHVPDPTLPAPDIPGGSVGSYTPGAEAQVMAEGAGAPVPGGGMLNFQMHYTTNGKPSVDHTQVGFYVMKTPPKYIKRSVVISQPALYIPAGEARHKEVAYLTFPADAYIYTLYPHSHYRGMHVELWQKTADGKLTPLIVLPKYDFNWQRDYDPVTPILVHAGTKLIATWVYDNSVHNKANPDPKRNVTWGEQTPDEMMYFRVNYRFADETVSHVRNDLQNALQGSAAMGDLDANADDLIQPSELTGRWAPLKARFSEFDKDHNGGLDAKELKAAMAAIPGMDGRAGRGRQASAAPAAAEVPDL